MSTPSSLESSSANLKRLWLQHKDVLNRLYITENKTLVQVKHAMEMWHEFPTLRLHDYEVALRDILKFRKNLKREDWYAIGVGISHRKKQGKDSEVLWNNSPMATSKVRKEVLRNRKPNHFYPRHTGAAKLPVGVIIRTPPSSPQVDLAVLVPRTRLRSDADPIISASSHNTPSVRETDAFIWDAQLVLGDGDHAGTSRFRHLRENIPFNRFLSELLKLAKLHSLLITVPVEQTSRIPGPQLFGCNPSLDLLARFTFQLSNKILIHRENRDYDWFLNWLGVSADFNMLKTFFSVKTPTVCAMYEYLCWEAKDIRRSTLARVLFEIRDKLRQSRSLIADKANFLDIAVHIGSRKEGMFELAKRAFQVECGTTLHNGTHVARQQHLQSLFLIAAARRDLPIMRLLVGAVMRSDDKSEFIDDHAVTLVALVMRQLYIWDPKEKDIVALYLQLLIQGGILSARLSTPCCYDDRPKVAIHNPQSLTIDEMVMICPPTMRSRLYDVVAPWSNDHRVFISKAGVFTAALEGAEGLLAYLRPCKQNDDLEIRTTLQECLLFAASLNDTQTASALLQLGVDPEVGLLSSNKERYHKGVSSWNPMIIAAAAGNLETLDLLGSSVNLVAFLKSAPVFEIIHTEDSQTRYWAATGREIRRLENLRRHLLYSQTNNSDAAVADGRVHLPQSPGTDKLRSPNHPLATTSSWFFIVEKRRIKTITWIRTTAAAHGIGDTVNKEIIAAALFNDPETWVLQCRNAAYHPCDVLLLDGVVDANLEYREGDMDLLQLSLRAQCSLEVVEFLLSKGLRVHSRAAEQSGNTMLHDALLSRSHDRSKIVHLLLREGADYQHCGMGLTILEASLHGKDFHQETEPCTEYLDIFTHLFEAGSPLRHGPQPQSKKWEPLICRLLDAKASDELILRVVNSGADLNRRGLPRDKSLCYGGITPLESAIFHRREKLAREFIRRGADVIAMACGDRHPAVLQAVCESGCSLEFVQFLVRQQGANVNEAPQENDGITALQWAALLGSLSMAEFLLDQGADINAISGKQALDHSPDRCRALDFAAQTGRLDMVEFLLKAGGRSSTAGLGGAIYMSKKNGHFAVLSVLLEWQKEHSRTILDEEAKWQRQHPDAARLLLPL